MISLLSLVAGALTVGIAALIVLAVRAEIQQTRNDKKWGIR